MAPRGRPRKKNTRMDAAVDAMRPYGFKEDLILRKLKELLDVYGEEHWFFIEENSYKVLLEAILEQVEQEERQRDEAIYGSSSEVLPLPYADTGALNSALPSNESVDPASLMDGTCQTALLTYKSDGNDHLPPSGKGSDWQDITLDRSSGKKLVTNEIETDDMDVGNIHVIQSTNLSSLHVNQSQQSADGFPIRRRRPYHGWISDGEDEPELVELEPAPLPPEIAKILFGTDVRRKRRSGWDLRPEDM